MQGEKLHTRIHVVNDNEEDVTLKPMSMAGMGESIVDETNKVLVSAREHSAVEYWRGRKYIEPNIHMPLQFTGDKVTGKLKLTHRKRSHRIAE